MRIAAYITSFCLIVLIFGVLFNVLSSTLNVDRNLSFGISVIIVFVPALLFYGFIRTSASETDRASADSSDIDGK